MGKGYTKRVPNALLTDTRLSAWARLLMVYIIGRPRRWEYIPAAICKELGISDQMRKAATNELVNAGWLVRERERKPSGTFGRYIYTPTVAQPSVENPTVAQPSVAESTDIIIKDIRNKDIRNKECEPPAASGGTHTSLDLFRMNLTKAADGKRVPAAILRKFEAYWTQEAKDGRQLWQVTRPFDFAKRLNKWLEDERAI